jgi:hypothetical protein
MKFKTKMMYLGFKTAQSKKSGNSYLLVNMMDTETSGIYEFYVPADRLQLVTDIGQLQQFTPVNVMLGMSSFNNKPQIDLEGVSK